MGVALNSHDLKDFPGGELSTCFFFARIFKKNPCLLGSMLHVNQIDCIRRSTNIEQARFFVMAFDFFLEFFEV